MKYSIFPVLLFWVFPMWNPAHAQQPLNSEDLITDIQYLQDVLYEIHPSPFRYSSRDSLDFLFNRLTDKAQEGMTLAHFEQQVKNLLISVGCIHTNGRRKPKKTKKETPQARIIPYEFFTDGEGLWTTKATLDTFTQFQWHQVLAIDTNDTKMIMQKLMQYHPSDGYNTSFMRRLLSRGLSFAFLYPYYFGADSLLQFTFEGEQGDTIITTIPKLQLRAGGISDKKTEPSEEWTLSVKNHFFRAEQQWAVLKLNSFNPYKRKTKRFYRDVFQTLEEQNISSLVIDLRDNLGGSISDANTILRHILDENFVIFLERRKGPTFKYSSCSSKISFFFFSIKRGLEIRKKYKKDEFKVSEFKTRVARRNNFEGQVYVLTNGYSASSSSYLAAFLKYKENAIIIGEESGGGSAGNNGLYYTTVILPNSKIRIRIPYYWLDYQLIKDEGRGVMPDVPIRYTIDDIKKNRDLEMEWIKSNLGKD